MQITPRLHADHRLITCRLQLGYMRITNRLQQVPIATESQIDSLHCRRGFRWQAYSTNLSSTGLWLVGITFLCGVSYFYFFAILVATWG
jgi:hypothetical protein